MDQTRLAFVNALLANRVASRYVEAFKATPLMSQVKVSLLALEKKANECERHILLFKRELQSEVDNYYDWMEEMLPDEVKRKTAPIYKMFKGIASGKVAADDFDDVKKAGHDLMQIAAAASRDASYDKSQKSTIESIGDTGEEVIKTVEEILSRDLPPLPWWSKNLEQVSMIANMHTENAADEALVKSIEQLSKAIKDMFTVGAGLEEALKDIQDLTGKAMKAMKAISLPENPDAEPGVPGARPRRKSPGAPKAKKPTFAEVRVAIFDRLKKDGWKLQENLKIPHATSPDGKTRLWFKAQSVYGNDPGTDPRDYKNTHSWVSDLREYTDPNKFMQMVERRSKD